MINISNDPWDPPYPPLTFSPCQSGAATLLNLRPETAEDHELGGEDERAKQLVHESVSFEYYFLVLAEDVEYYSSIRQELA